MEGVSCVVFLNESWIEAIEISIAYCAITVGAHANQVPIHEHLAIRAKGGVHSVSPFLLVKIHTDEDLVGLGEVSCTPRWSGEDQVTAAHFITAIFTPLLIGHDPRDIERLSLKIRHA